MIFDLQKPVADARIKIPRTPDFYAVARKLSEYIKDLPLSHEQNDRLIALMVEQVKVTEQDCFKAGLKLGSDIWKAHAGKIERTVRHP